MEAAPLRTLHPYPEPEPAPEPYLSPTLGNTALHRACANGHVAVVQQLAAAGAGLLANESGNSPLHWAVQHASAPLVAAVLQAGPWPLAPSPNCSLRINSPRWRLQAFPGADVLARNAFGKSVSTEAFARNVPEIVDAARLASAPLRDQRSPSLHLLRPFR